MARTTRRPNATLSIDSLEAREVPTVSTLWFNGDTLCVKTDNAATSVEVRTSGSNVRIAEVGSGRTWDYAASRVGKVEFQGGNGNDRFVNMIANLPVKGYGNGGNDYLEGYNGADYFDGGAGNDTVKAYGENDTVFGGTGNDVLLGMNGTDQLMGQDGDDRLNGGDGADSLWGGAGNDVLIAIDNGTGDFAQGDAGSDAVWVDQTGSTLDRVAGADAGDKTKAVKSFLNGADRTLNGDRIADPMVKAGLSYRTFANNPLFSDAGPKPSDIRQGDLGDCWLLAGLGGIALDGAMTLRQSVVDFDDGTYGVSLGNAFYRVDNDLPVSGTTPAFAKLGADNSMWVAVVEKAFADYRRGQNSYASLDGGYGDEAQKAFGSTSAGRASIGSYASATALANDLYARWNTYQSVTIGFDGPDAKKPASSGAPLIMNHAYTVVSFTRNASGVVTGITVRNPWGRDGAGNDSNPNDGLVTLTPAQAFAHAGTVYWGRV